MVQAANNGLGPNFFVIVTGKTKGAHQDIVSKLKSRGQTEVSSDEQSDYLLVFCPITSRVGTDIGEALEKIPGGKPIILVVMHHTFSPEQVVAPSRRQVENPNVRLTVDCLFYEGKLLQSERNDTAWGQIQVLLGLSMVMTRLSDRIQVFGSCKHWLWKNLKLLTGGAAVIMILSLRRKGLWNNRRTVGVIGVVGVTWMLVWYFRSDLPKKTEDEQQSEVLATQSK